MPETREPKAIDPFKSLELPAAVFVLNITLFVIVWKTVGLSWLPFELDISFQEVFLNGYYPRDMERHESQYNWFYFALYGILGTAAQVASIRLWWIRKNDGEPGISRSVFSIFHLMIGIYHVLFVFQIVRGKMLLDDMSSIQMIATQALYIFLLLMSVEIVLIENRNSFFRRKVCMDIVSACNMIPFLVYWFFSIVSYQNAVTISIVQSAFFTIIPLAIVITEWVTALVWRPHSVDQQANHQ